MKTSAIIRYLDSPVAPYPNAATRRRLLEKALDLLLITAICAGISACIVFLTVFF